MHWIRRGHIGLVDDDDKGVGKIYRKQGRSGCSGAVTFLDSVNHGAETFSDEKNHGTVNFFDQKNHRADTFSIAGKITGQRLFQETR